MTFDRDALERRLGASQRIVVRPLSAYEDRPVELNGWHIGTGEASDAQDSHVAIPATTTIAIWLLVDYDVAGILDTRPRADRPEAATWRYTGQPVQVRVADSLEALDPLLRESGALYNAPALDRALAAARACLESLTEG